MIFYLHISFLPGCDRALCLAPVKHFSGGIAHFDYTINDRQSLPLRAAPNSLTEIEMTCLAIDMVCEAFEKNADLEEVQVSCSIHLYTPIPKSITREWVSEKCST